MHLYQREFLRPFFAKCITEWPHKGGADERAVDTRVLALVLRQVGLPKTLDPTSIARSLQTESRKDIESGNAQKCKQDILVRFEKRSTWPNDRL